MQKSSPHRLMQHEFRPACSVWFQRPLHKAWWTLALFILISPGILRAQFGYSIQNGTATITSYRGPGGQLSIPSKIDGLPVTAIGQYMLAGCSDLTSIKIPDSITNIPNYAFDGCTSLTNITVDSLNPSYSSVDGVLFDRSCTTLVLYPVGRGGAYTVPESVTKIAEYAFSSALNLTSVSIPEAVTSVGVGAFSSCTGLTHLTLPGQVSELGGGLFSGCTSLQYIAIPDSVTSLGDGVFQGCTGLREVVLGKSLTRIPDYTFGDCISLTSLTVWTAA